MIKGPLEKLVVKVSPTIYFNYIINSSKGKPFLCMRIQKALYRLLSSVFLFYSKLVNSLRTTDFK